MKTPRIVTHLFADGGRIIKTTRTEYAEHVGRPDVQAFVRSLMKEQHKGMFTALRQGQLDALLEQVCGPFEQALQVSQVPPSMASALPPEFLSAPPAAPSVLPGQPVVDSSLTERAPAPEFDPPTLSSAFGDESPAAATEPEARKGTLSNPNLRKVTPSVPPPSASAFDLDVAVLEHLPTKPAPNVPRPDRSPEPLSVRPLHKSRTAVPPSPGPVSLPQPNLSRPSSRFAAIPSKPSQSIFGDGVISEQSLDEVILSYLAEDLDGSSD